MHVRLLYQRLYFAQELGAGHVCAAHEGQMRGVLLAVYERCALDKAEGDEGGERDARAVGDVGEHGFAKDGTSEGDAVEAGDKLPFSPHFHAVRAACAVQGAVGAAHVGAYPGAALPGGFMEQGETLREGAARETREEAGAQFELGECIALLSVPRISQIHSFHLALLTSEIFAPGPETQQARLFPEEEIPWQKIAFETVRVALRHYFACRRAGRFTLLEECIA